MSITPWPDAHRPQPLTVKTANRWPATALMGPALGALLALGACDSTSGGPDVTETRNVGAFNAIELRGAARVDVLVGPAASISLVGSRQTIDRTTTRVENGRLILEQRRAWLPISFGNERLQARLTLPLLQSFTLNGAGQASINGITVGELQISLQGAGQIEAVGTAPSVEAVINGAGQMDLSRLVAQRVTATVNGAGQLELHATESLAATLNGVGQIRYQGNPSDVKSQLNGVGQIAPADAQNQ